MKKDLVKKWQRLLYLDGWSIEVELTEELQRPEDEANVYWSVEQHTIIIYHREGEPLKEDMIVHELLHIVNHVFWDCRTYGCEECKRMVELGFEEAIKEQAHILLKHFGEDNG